MAGFLESLMDPSLQGALSLSANLLRAGGPSPYPVPFGSALGSAFSGFQGDQQKQALLGLEQAKMGMLQQQLKQAQAQFAMQQGILAKAGLLGGPQAPQGPTPPSQLASAGPTAPGMSAGTSQQAFGTPDYASSGPTAPAPQAPAAPSTPPAGQFPFNTSQVAAMHLAGFPDLTGAYNASQPNVDIRNGIMFDKKSGQILSAVPQTNQQGFSTITVPDKNSPNGYRVEVVPGAVPAYLAQQRAGAQATAERDLVTVPPTSPNSPPTFRSRESLLPNAPSPVAGPMAAPAAGTAAGMSPAAGAAQAATAEQQKAISLNYGNIYNNLQNASMANPGKIAKTERIGDLLKDFEGGKFSKTAMGLAQAFNSAGFKIDSKLPNKEAAEALSGEIALDLRSTAGGGGMPGAMSDADREFLKGMTPALGQTAEGRKTIIESKVKVMQRENEVAGMARQYKKKYGSLDEDFFSQLSGWSARNPLFKK